MIKNIISATELLKIKAENVLWHGVDFFNAKDILDRGFFEAHTSQRFWVDGIRRKESDPQYNDSKWMYGWSMSRDIEVSKNFGFLIFAFKKEELKKTMKVKPYSWNYSLASGVVAPKREREEFVLSGGEIESQSYYNSRFTALETELDAFYDDMYSSSEEESKVIQAKIDKLEKEIDESDFFKNFSRPHGKTLSVSKAKGFFINKSRSHTEEEISYFASHPLFLGFI